MTAVNTVGTYTVLPLTNKSSSFSSDPMAVNDNKGMTFLVRFVNQSSFSCAIELQQSQDITNWITVPRSIRYVTGNDGLVFNVFDTSSALHFRLKFTILSGNADIEILARGA